MQQKLQAMLASEGEAFRARNHADRSLFHAAYTSDLPKGKLLPRNLKLATYNGMNP